MPSHLSRVAALAAVALAAACGGPADLGTNGLEADVDALSATTYSMEMVRKNPSLMPSVQLIEGRFTKGRPAPAARDIAGRNVHVPPSSWLYTANQLDQFLKLPDPAIHPDDKGDATFTRQPGDLFAADGVLKWDNVEQGHLGDCYFAASLAAVLFADKAGALGNKLIIPRTVGGKVVSYYVYFYQASGRRVRIEVDPDLLHRNANGHILYMDSTDNKPGYEEWAPSLIEKAYAQWHGSYKAIGDGGAAADAIYALIGKRTKSYSPTSAATVTAIESAGKAGRAQAACTYGDNDGVNYDNTGIYSDHCSSATRGAPSRCPRPSRASRSRATATTTASSISSCRSSRSCTRAWTSFRKRAQS
jgi:hypothetical protein